MSSDGTLSWEYLAGFTDGDGSIYLGKNGNNYIHWTQKSPKVLFEIKKFLFEFGIETTTIQKHSGRTTYDFRATTRKGVARISREISFYSINKAEKLRKLTKIDPKPIGWKYLAGFTDAEGSINLKRYSHANPAVRVSWPQKYDESFVLDEIKEFVWEKTGISLHDFTGSRWTSYGYFSTERTLSLVNNSSTRIILNHLIPFLVVKKDAALGAIDYLNEFDFNRIKYGRNFASKLVVV